MRPFILRPELSLTANLASVGVAHVRETGARSFGKRALSRDGEDLGSFSNTQIWAALRLHADGADLVEALAKARSEVA